MKFKHSLISPSPRNGLTLVELLIVLGILSVLAGIALPVTRNLIAENRVSESVRTVQSFIEAARAKAMSSGRDHAVIFLRGRLDPTLLVADPNGAGDVLATCTELKMAVGMPNYRGDVEGAQAFVYHESTLLNPTFDSSGTVTGVPPVAALTAFANCAIFRATDCPTLLQSLTVLSERASGTSINKQISVSDNDHFVFDGVRAPITGFSTCSGTEPPFTTFAPGPPGNFVKIYFNPTHPVPRRLPGQRDAVAVPEPPILPAGQVWRRSFEIERKLLRPTANSLKLQRGAAVDLLYSGLGAGGAEFSPVTIAGAASAADLAAPTTPYWDVGVVFSPSGAISRVVYGQLQVGGAITLITRVPPSSVHFLVGRSEEVRADLNFLGRLPTNNSNDLSNLVDTRARWLSINPVNGRITATAVKTPNAAATNVYEQLINARFPALEAREQL